MVCNLYIDYRNRHESGELLRYSLVFAVSDTMTLHGLYIDYRNRHGRGRVAGGELLKVEIRFDSSALPATIENDDIDKQSILVKTFASKQVSQLIFKSSIYHDRKIHGNRRYKRKSVDTSRYKLTPYLNFNSPPKHF
ncbi:hypothetical protein LIER_28999 [Lithospermum erythrorhizon]|uniref:Uncharacterized protein n=1 Tax=Lithospermum erythrorhizon TaxID=34254 RepID=A0AAV3RMM4_LITER